MQNLLSVGSVAARLGVPPKTISDFFYLQRLDASRAPMIAGRRCIDEDYMPEIAEILRAWGKLPAEPAAV